MDTYKPFTNPTNPCENTIKFKTKRNQIEWEQILQQIKERKKEKNKIRFNQQYKENEIDIYTDGSYKEETK